jgi:cytochrome P450
MQNKTVDGDYNNAPAPLPPLVPGMPILGSALAMTRDPLSSLVDLYKQYGPIFRMRALRREFTVIAGQEANQFLAKHGEEYLGSRELFGGLAEELQTDVFMVAMDGEPHRKLRKIMRRGFSREAIQPQLPFVLDIARDSALSWPVSKRIPLLKPLQKLVTQQLGIVLANHPPGEYFEDVWTFLSANMRANVIKSAPAITLKLPAYQKAKQRIFELGRIVVQEHRDTPPEGQFGRPDLIDDMLAAKDEEGKPFSEEALVASAISPFFAGMDTVASTCAFMLYGILKHPHVLKRVRQEVDELFAGGQPGIKEFREAKALHGAAMETLRMYPVAAFTPRTVLHTFEFAGHRIDKGSEILIANGVTHHLEEFFPEPSHFDIDRFHKPRSEHRQAGVFAPYSLGAHTCLGAGLAEVQIMATVAAILHAVDLQLDPPDYELEIVLAPIPSPGNKFAVRVGKQRNL